MDCSRRSWRHSRFHFMQFKSIRSRHIAQKCGHFNDKRCVKDVSIGFHRFGSFRFLVSKKITWNHRIFETWKNYVKREQVGIKCELHRKREVRVQVQVSPTPERPPSLSTFLPLWSSKSSDGWRWRKRWQIRWCCWKLDGFTKKIGFFSPKNWTNMYPVGKQIVSRKKKMDFETKELVRKRRVVKKINSRKKWIDESIYVKMKLHFWRDLTKITGNSVNENWQ